MYVEWESVVAIVEPGFEENPKPWQIVIVWSLGFSYVLASVHVAALVRQCRVLAGTWLLLLHPLEVWTTIELSLDRHSSNLLVYSIVYKQDILLL